jgi:hypothetical protein
MLEIRRKNVKRIAALVLFVCGLCGSGVCQYTAAFSSYHGDKVYDFRITPGQLAMTPAWLEDEPNPPLPARRAQVIAVAYLGELLPMPTNGGANQYRWSQWVTDGCIRLSLPNLQEDAPTVRIRLSGSW